VVASDAAWPLLSVFAAPTCVPPDGQPAAVTSFGWHRKKVTVPVGVGCPAPRVTVAVSVTAVPGTSVVEFVLACVAIGGIGVLKHSRVTSV
jgi:hypothetical protein